LRQFLFVGANGGLLALHEVGVDDFVGPEALVVGGLERVRADVDVGGAEQFLAAEFLAQFLLLEGRVLREVLRVALDVRAHVLQVGLHVQLEVVLLKLVSDCGDVLVELLLEVLVALAPV